MGILKRKRHGLEMMQIKYFITRLPKTILKEKNSPI